MTKKTDKQRLFEIMHKVAGMPLNEDAYNPGTSWEGPFEKNVNPPEGAYEEIDSNVKRTGDYIIELMRNKTPEYPNDTHNVLADEEIDYVFRNFASNLLDDDNAVEKFGKLLSYIGNHFDGDERIFDLNSDKKWLMKKYLNLTL